MTDRDESGSEDHLVIHPRVLALGVGCERGASFMEVAGAGRGHAWRARSGAGGHRLHRLDRAEGGRAGAALRWRTRLGRAAAAVLLRPSWRRRRHGSPTRRRWCSRRPAAMASPRARRSPRPVPAARWWSPRPSRSTRLAQSHVRPPRSIRSGSAGRRAGSRSSAWVPAMRAGGPRRRRPCWTTPRTGSATAAISTCSGARTPRRCTASRSARR